MLNYTNAAKLLKIFYSSTNHNVLTFKIFDQIINTT